MSVLLCTTGINCLGETFTAAMFAQELARAGIESYFIAPVLGRNYLRTFGLEEDRILVLSRCTTASEEKVNRASLLSFFNRASPKVIIVADWHHFSDNGRSNNRSYYLDWLPADIPMGTFDHLGAPEMIKFLDIVEDDGEVHSKPFGDLQVRISFVIRPCPHHDNRMAKNEMTFYWPIYREAFDTYGEGESRTSADNGEVEPKVVLHPISVWQQRELEKKQADSNVAWSGEYYRDIFREIMLECLGTIKMKIDYNVIVPGIDKTASWQVGHVTVIERPVMKHVEFMHLLAQTDVLLTDNIISSNIGKAIFSDVIPVVMVSSVMGSGDRYRTDFEVSDSMQKKLLTLQEGKLLFPFLTFPTGFNSVAPLYSNNLFSNTFVKQELFDQPKCEAVFKDLLYRGRLYTQIAEAQRQYIAGNKMLPSAAEIVRDVLNA